MNPQDNKSHNIFKGSEIVMRNGIFRKGLLAVAVVAALMFILPGATTFANKNEQRPLEPFPEPGFIVAWGDNQYGECTVPSPNSGFIAVAAGDYHSLGLKADGSIVAWGWNQYGQCTVPSPNSGFTAVSAGYWHSLGLKVNGSIVAWGYSNYGQCNVPSPNTGFTAVAAGSWHSLGLKADGSVVAWGWNPHGQCTVPSPNSGFTAVAAGEGHSLGLKADGSIVGWGWNFYGQCTVPSPNSGFTAVAAGDAHSLVLMANGSVVAWGDNWFGQCNVPSPNTDFVAVAAGAWHSLGLKADGSIVAWGWNVSGQCNVPSPNSGFTAVAAGQPHSLGLKAGTTNTPPNEPSNPIPQDNATETPITNLTLWWDGGDPDIGDLVQYTVFFGDTPDPPEIGGIMFTPWNNTPLNWNLTENLSYNTKYYWKIVAMDNHNVTSEGPLWSFTTLTDITPPETTHEFSGTTGNNDWYINNVHIILNASDDLSGVGGTFFKIDDSQWTNYTIPVIITLDGEHQLWYYSVDQAGNIEPIKGPFGFKIDKTPPTITLTKQQIDLFNVKFTAEVSDATSGINRVEFSLDGVLQYNDTQSPYEWTWTGLGDHTVTATAFDFAGNSQSQSMSTPVEQIQGFNTFYSQMMQQLMKLGLRKQLLS
jgi:hypothetical protein